MRILIRVGDLDDGASITMRTGEKVYTVRRSIMVYDHTTENREEKVVKCMNGAVFLVDGRGNVNAYGEDLKVLWCASRTEVYRYLYPEEDK